jgi:hypothetical protein
LRETIERERDAAAKQEHIKLQEELKNMANLIKKNEELRVGISLTIGY